MRKILLICLFLALPLSASAGLWQYYHENGEILPSVSNRAVIAAQYGIMGYRGAVGQNNLLESILRGQKSVGFSVATDFQKTLRSGMTSSQNFFYPSNMTLKDGTSLTMAALGEKVFFTIEPGGAREEIVMCTGINNTAVSVTGCTRGLGFSGTSTAAVVGNAKAHNSGSIVVMSNVHYVYEQYVDTNYKTQTINGPKTFASGTVALGDGTSAADKCLSISNGDANSPKICYNESASKFYLYNDGVNSYDFTAGGSGLAAGYGITISGGKINFAPAATSTSGMGSAAGEPTVAKDADFTWTGTHTFNGTQTKFANPINTSSTIYSSASTSSTIPMLNVGWIGATSTQATTTVMNNLDIRGDIQHNGNSIETGEYISASTGQSSSALNATAPAGAKKVIAQINCPFSGNATNGSGTSFNNVTIQSSGFISTSSTFSQQVANGGTASTYHVEWGIRWDNDGHIRGGVCNHPSGSSEACNAIGSNSSCSGNIVSLYFYK